MKALRCLFVPEKVPSFLAILILSRVWEIASRVSATLEELSDCLCRSVVFFRLREAPQTGLLYFFFNHSNQNQKAKQVIRVLLKQVLQQLQQIQLHVQNEYKRYIKSPHKIPTNLETLQRLLKSCVQEYYNLSGNRIFILIDALDELRGTRAEEENRERTNCLSCLQQLSETGQVRVLISTRLQYREILQRTFPDLQICAVRGDQGDIERYLDYRLDSILVPSFRGKIKKTILEANKSDNW